MTKIVNQKIPKNFKKFNKYIYNSKTLIPREIKIINNLEHACAYMNT